MIPPEAAAPNAVEDDGRPRSPWRIESAGALLTILALINFLNYLDRYVIAALVPYLTAARGEGGLGLDLGDVGLLQTAFMVVHAVASIPLGLLADRWLRTRLISIGVAVWSVATFAAGFARSFGQMFASRSSVGIGEATYAPAASALISDRFAPATRARAMAVFQLGTVIGGAMGIALGGIVARAYGWRAAFFVVGAPGLLLAALALFVREPRRARPPAPVTRVRASTIDRLRKEVASATEKPGSVPAVLFIQLAGILIAFFTGAISIFAPEYLLSTRYGGDKSHMRDVALSYGPIVVVAGVLGVLTGSSIADRLEKRRPGVGRLAAVAIGVICSAPCAGVAFLSTTPWIQNVALGFGTFFCVWYVGPILAALHDVVAERQRGTVTGAYFCLIHLLGDGVSPWVIGHIGDATGSLRAGLLLATGVLLLGGLAAIAAMPGARRAKLEVAR